MQHPTAIALALLACTAQAQTLQWDACPWGQAASGATCTGTPAPLTWQQALQAAQTANAALHQGHGVTLVLSARMGETFEATVIDWDADRRRGIVQVSEPAVQAAVVGKVELGSEITATLVRADTEAGVVEFRAS